MQIRKTAHSDIAAVLNIYSEARGFMRESGNHAQWKGNYPSEEMVKSDIDSGRGYVCESGGEVAAAFYYSIESDPTYTYIEGAWLNDEPYGVVHRIAVKRGTKGMGEYCLNWAFQQCGNLKIDTHIDNRPMRKLLGKLGFAFCGKIWVFDGTEERIAFQKESAHAKTPEAPVQGLNVIWVFSPDANKALFCKRQKDPYKGLYNLVGGKIELGEGGISAACRELREETSIEGVELIHLMDFTYFLEGACRVEVYVGRLSHETEVHGDEKELVWLDMTENFFDMGRFAGEGNIGHIYELIKLNSLGE